MPSRCVCCRKERSEQHSQNLRDLEGVLWATLSLKLSISFRQLHNHSLLRLCNCQADCSSSSLVRWMDKAFLMVLWLVGRFGYVALLVVLCCSLYCHRRRVLTYLKHHSSRQPPQLTSVNSEYTRRARECGASERQRRFSDPSRRATPTAASLAGAMQRSL